MKDKINSIHWSFWVIAVLGLLWNLMACVNFFMQMNPEVVAKFPESHQAIIVGRPIWATSGFAICVFGGAMACILLLLKKSSAIYLFFASLLGVIVTMIHTLKVSGSLTQSEIIIMIVSPTVVAFLLLCYAIYSKNRSWIY